MKNDKQSKLNCTIVFNFNLKMKKIISMLKFKLTEISSQPVIKPLN